VAEKHCFQRYNGRQVRQKLKNFILLILTFCVVSAVYAVTAKEYYDAGLKLYSNKDYQKAVQYFDAVIQLEPDNSAALLGRANCYYSMGQYQDALTNYKKVAVLQPQNAQVTQLIETLQTKIGNSSATNTEGMVLIKAGEFQMGSPEDSEDANQHPIHKVWLKAFYIDSTEVTFDQFDKFALATDQERPSSESFSRGNCPVMNITWNDANDYCKWIGKRLPTEAEWEKAARGGTTTKWCFGDDFNGIDAYVWYFRNAGGNTHPVGQLKPNPFGLFDMNGNVWEWVSDWYDPSYYSQSPDQNPPGPESGKYKVIRGGSWEDTNGETTNAIRQYELPFKQSTKIGCRCARDP
jgi:formylglycine-generating enzyme required for sulfatase activity